MRFALVALAACGGSGLDLTPEPACPDCGPGEVRFALGGPHVQAGAAALDARSDGTFSYITDHALVLLDDALVEQARATFEDPDHRLALGVAGNGDSTYVLEADSSQVVATDVAGRVLAGFDQSGQLLWSTNLAVGTIHATLVADTVGPYAAVEGDVAAYSSDGILRLTFASPQVVRALPHGGLITFSNGAQQCVIGSLFPTGPTRWSRTWTLVEGSSLRLVDAATTDGGEVAVVARFTGRALDLDGTPFTAPAAGTFVLVALLAFDGSVRWATLLGAIDGDLRIAVTGPNQVVLGGSFRGDGTALGLPEADERDGFLAIVDSGGVVRSDLLGGPGDQHVEALRPGSDGMVALTIANGDGMLTIGAHTFPDDAPHDFVVEMLP